jgi:GNAT superfamily N-acetyltransferase
MDTNVIIREIIKDDIAAIATTFCFPWTTLTATTEKWKNYYNEHINLTRFVAIVEIMNNSVGYGSLLYHSKYPHFNDSNIPEINDIWIKENYRKHGIGKKLIDFLEKKARLEGYLQIGIGVGLYSDYGSAQRLYIKLGYMPDGKGITYKNKDINPGQNYPVDDELILWLIKQF